MTAAAARPVCLRLEPDPVFGVLHAAAEPRADVAVLMCAPFGWEEMVSHRGRRAWAEHLAAAGIPVLRIDLPGTGDSGGAARDRDRVDAWTHAIGGAARWLRGATGCRQVAAVGLGLGGFLAVHALAHGAPLDALVLWGVPARGRTLVRELHAFARLEGSRLAAQGAPHVPPPGGAVAAAGYLLTAGTRAALEAIDLRELPALTANVLLLDRDGAAPDTALQDALTAAGATVTTAPGAGWAELVMGDMQSFRAPVEVFAATASWVRDLPAPAAAPDATPPPEETPTLELDNMRETPLAVPTPDGPLPGVLAEPADGVERQPLCLVLLNAGPQRRTGPSRMWVEIARRWAARGVTSLRLDVSGVGDAPGRSHGWEDEQAFYDGRHLREVRAALDALQARGVRGPFLTVGVCSGANWAFHTAVEDPRVSAGIALNPRALFWDPLTTRARGGRELHRLLSPALWRRLAGGEVSRQAARVSARALAGWLTALPALLRRRLLSRRSGSGDPLARALDRLEAAGHRLTIVFTDREPLRAELAASGALDRLDRRPAVTLRHVETGAETHTLQPLWVQHAVHELVDDAIAAELAQSG